MENILPHSPCIQYVALADYLYYFQGCGSQKSFQLLDLATLQESVILGSVDSGYTNGLAVYEETAYWTTNTGVYSVPFTGGGNVHQLFNKSSDGHWQIRVVHPDLQPDHPWNITFSPSFITPSPPFITGSATTTSSSLPTESYSSHSSHSFVSNNTTHEATIALLSSTTHPQSWLEPHIHVQRQILTILLPLNSSQL